MKSIALFLVSGMSVCLAQTWTDITAKVPTGPKGASQSLASTGTTLYLTTFDGIRSSTNDGNTWTLINTVAGKTYTLADFGTRSLDAINGTVWAGGEPGSLSITGGVLPLHRLASGAKGWTPSFTGTTAPFAIDVVAYDSITKTHWCAGRLGSIYKSTNGGSTWQEAKGDLPGTNIASIVARNGKVIVTLQGSGAYSSSNDGKNWSNNGVPLPDIGRLAAVGNQVVVIGSGNTTLDTGAYVSKDFGTTWTLNQSYMNGSRLLMKTCTDDKLIFAGGMVTTFTPTFTPIFTPTVAWSADGGTTWEELDSKGMPQGLGISSMVRHGKYLFVQANDFSGNQKLFRRDVSAIGKPPGPDIAVLQPANSDLKDGTNRTFGTVKTGSTGAAKTFTLRNTGKAPLTGIRFSKSGTHAAEFLVDAPATTRLDPGKSTTFKVRFKPKSKGTRNAVLKINSNDKDENPFDIRLSGQGAAK